MEVRVVEVDLVERRPLQVDLLEAGVGEVLLVEVGHDSHASGARRQVRRQNAFPNGSAL